MTEPMQDSLSFRTAARRVVRRLFAAHWFRLLSRSAVVIFPAAALLAACLWHLDLAQVNVWLAVALIPCWLTLTCLWAWIRRPTAESALAYWDDSTARDEMFMSAYCFESQPTVDTGERLHLNVARNYLTNGMANLSRDLPVRCAHRVWMLPLVFLGLTILSLTLSTPAQQPQRVAEPDRERAEEIAQTLAAQTKLADKEKGLDPAEEEKLKQLEESVKETVEKLRALDNETQRDVLAELEEKAHQAEQLADELDSPVEETLSSKMLEELARHADTTDFASAMQAKDLQQASDQSKELAKRLDDKDLTREVRKRIGHALDSAMDVASEEDKKGLVGKHLKQADQELKRDQPKKAADQLQRLSKQLNRAQQRELAKQQLEQLARALRNSGQQIFGRDTSEIRRLAQDAGHQQGMQQLGNLQLQEMGNLQLGQRMAAAQQGQEGQLGQGMILTPAPPGQQNPDGLILAPIPGTGAPMAPGNMPIPGAGNVPIPGAGQSPIPGSGMFPGAGQGSMMGQGQGAGAGVAAGTAMGQGAGDGGHRAGHGSATYGNTQTNPLAATGTGVVDAQVSGAGPAQVREVMRGPHREATSRSAQDLAIEFLKIEEEALAEEPLPLSRRQQVLRYFTALRRQLVDREPSE